MASSRWPRRERRKDEAWDLVKFINILAKIKNDFATKSNFWTEILIFLRRF